jgi:hypothetical protein
VLTMWFAPCTPSGTFVAPDHLVRFPVKPTGAFGNPFEYDVTMTTGGKRHFAYAFSGRVTSRATTGRLQVKVSDTDAAGAAAGSCDSGPLTWKATTG